MAPLVSKLKKAILIELDSILDTRLPIFISLDEKNTLQKLKSKEYHYRVKDNLANVSAEIFNIVYQNRNKGLLQYAIPTPLVPKIVAYQYSEMMMDKKADNGVEMTFYINTYPYNLTESEAENIIKMIRLIFKDEKDHIEIVNLSLQELTPFWIEEHNIRSMYMYNGLEWVNVQASNLNLFKKPLLNVGLCCPVIFDGFIKDKEITEEYINDLTKAYETLINMFFIGSEYFSASLEKVD